MTFLGARDVMNGTLQPGQLVAFFGYSIFLTTPLRTAIDYVIMSTRAYVGAGSVLRVIDDRANRERPRRPARLAGSPLSRSRTDAVASCLERGQLGGSGNRTPR